MAGRRTRRDAFISYSHQLDAQIAARLQAGLQRFAKPWYKLRALRVFRDETSLAASPGCGPPSRKRFPESRWMILHGFPGISSVWVGSEGNRLVAGPPADQQLAGRAHRRQPSVGSARR